MSDSEAQLLCPGQIVDGRYEIVDLIGEGGFAFVYEARHVHIGRRVALKVLALDPRLYPELESRFQSEATLAARLDHPHVVAIHDFGFLNTPRLPYIAMAYLDGHDLDEELARGGALAPARAHRLALEALDALTAAHAAAIVHKDLKPSNLFLQHPGTERESVVLVDFGIAGLVSGDSRRTATGELCGTPAYLAPEYIEGAPLTAAVDVYQMGLLLVEMLTGRPVVDGPTPYSVLVQHCSGQLELPDRLLDSELGPILRKALAMSPDDRYRDAAEFAAELRRLDPALPGTRGTSVCALPRPGADRPVEDEARPPRPAATQPAVEAPSPAAQPATRSRRQVVAVALAALAVLAVAGTAVALLLSPPGLDATTTAEASTGMATSDMPPPEAAAPTPVVVSVTSSPGGAQVLRNGVVLGHTPMTLEVAPEVLTERIELELRAAGHTARTLSFVPSTQRELAVELVAELPPAAARSALPRVVDAPTDRPALDAAAEPPATDEPSRARRSKRRKKKKTEFVVIQ